MLQGGLYSINKDEALKGILWRSLAIAMRHTISRRCRSHARDDEWFQGWLFLAVCILFILCYLIWSARFSLYR